MRVAVAGLIGIAVFVVAAVVLTLIGAFSFRMLLGVSRYRSSGTYIGVIAFGIFGALVLSVAVVWRFLTAKRG